MDYDGGDHQTAD